MSPAHLQFCILSSILMAGAILQEQPDPQPRIEVLIERLGAPELDRREKAAAAIRERWEQWTDEDLKKLEKAGASSDAELSSRAREARKSILQYRSFAVHLPVRLAGSGRLSIQGNEVLKSVDDPAAVSEAFKPYSIPPKDPAGKRIFVGLRFFLEVEREVPFEKVHQVLASAAKSMPLTDVVLVSPRRSGEPAPDDTDRLLLFTVRAQETRDGGSWKDKFISEVNYHYQTQQIKNAEVDALNKTVETLQKELAGLKERLKEKR